MYVIKSLLMLFMIGFCLALILVIICYRYDMILLYTLILSVIHLVKVIVNYYLVQKYRHITEFPDWAAEQSDKVTWLYLKHFKLENYKVIRLYLKHFKIKNRFERQQAGQHWSVIRQVNSRVPKETLRITIPICCLLYMIASKSWSGFPLASLAISCLYLYFTVYPSSIPLLDTRPYCGNIPMSILLVVCLWLSYCRLRRL